MAVARYTETLEVKKEWCESLDRMEKVVCPYCKVKLNLGTEIDEIDAVAQCSICHTITCELCTMTHYQKEHPLHIPWLPGYLDEKNIFHFKDFTFEE